MTKYRRRDNFDKIFNTNVTEKYDCPREFKRKLKSQKTENNNSN